MVGYMTSWRESQNSRSGHQTPSPKSSSSAYGTKRTGICTSNLSVIPTLGLVSLPQAEKFLPLLWPLCKYHSPPPSAACDTTTTHSRTTQLIIIKNVKARDGGNTYFILKNKVDSQFSNTTK